MDGLDPDVLGMWWDELPNFRNLRDSGAFARIDSVYPPDSIPAWASIYTGVTPDHHGILDSVDYLDIKNRNLKCDTSGLTGNTFWDAAGAGGKRVCVINPFLAYPVWPVNGIMANGPVFVSGEQQTYPQTLATEHNVPELGGIVDNPTRKTLSAFGEKTYQLTLDHLRFAKEMFAKEPWDLFFINFLTLDRVQHVFWRYFDTEDPTYPGGTEHSEVIKKFYKLHDDIIGEFLQLMDQDTVLFVISDHGHGRRCTKALCVNELLRQMGLLKSLTKRGKLDPKYILERTKSAVLRFLDNHELQELAYTIGRHIPGAKSLKKSTFVIDQKRSAAQVARFAGMNPYGGIDLPRDMFEGTDEDYVALVDRLIQGLKDLKDPKTGKTVVRWAKRREEMFTGPHSSIYPEIIFHLDFEYGVSRSLFGTLVDVNPSHRKISGGHMPQAALLMNRKASVDDECNSVLSVSTTVLGLLGVTAPAAMTAKPFGIVERER
jgi:predicted AlkP superfamily phosphohydrolase/phosphomutase